jgi:PiT family inorganic phosphate transporter
VGWLLTLPAAAIVGALSAWAASLGPLGILIDAVIGVAVIVAIFIISQRNRVSSKTALEGVNEVAESGRVVRIKKVKPKKSPTKRSAA